MLFTQLANNLNNKRNFKDGGSADTNSVYEAGITGLNIAKDFFLPEFITEPQDATFASVGIDLAMMFPIAKLVKGGKTLYDYNKVINKMNLKELNKEAGRINEGRITGMAKLSKKQEAGVNVDKEFNEFSTSLNNLSSKVAKRRQDIYKLDTAEKMMSGKNPEFRNKFSTGGQVSNFFTNLAANTGGYDPTNADEDMIVVGKRPEKIDYGKIFDTVGGYINKGLDIYNILNPTPPIVYPDQQQQNEGIASLQAGEENKTNIYTGGTTSDIKFADYLSELEDRKQKQLLLLQMMQEA
tara:strand:+ start:2706 stop:3593 length:888 start_codon:yes stop_codon:yes gene_type:complete